MTQTLQAITFLAVLFIVLPGISIAQDKKRAAPDHGRVLATCMEVAPGKLKDTTKLSDTKNYVFRGRVVSLGKDRTVSICYDTEHMRVAGAWVGAPLAYAADKNMGPSVNGDMIFTTRPGPGWAKNGKWEDPREGKEGPLPRDWAHYRGLYLHGDKVVLSYSVGDMSVLEMPDVIQKGAGPVIMRTLNVGPSTKPAKLLVCEEAVTAQDVVLGSYPQIKGADALLSGKSATLLVTAFGSSEIQFEMSEQRLLLSIPPLPQGGKFKVLLSRGADKKQAKAALGVVDPAIEDLASYTRGGPPRWNQVLETKGTPGSSTKEAYVIDQIEAPDKNPWNASIRFGGLDFFPDGRAALCTWDGDVWIVSGLNGKLDKVRWKRFACGLQQPLGLKIIDGIIYTAGRDQITKLHDWNNDGEADFYENFNNDAGLTLQRHEYVLDLQTDKQGNLYYCRSGHYIQSKRGDNCCVFKLSPDGSKLEKIASGFREPNGMSIGPDGTMTVSDNEGNSIPQTPIYRLKQGARYGFTPSLTGNPNQGSWKLQEQPIVWLGPKIDTSAGGQVWAPKEWGPLGGQLLHTSYGNCALFGVLIDRQADPWQGAVWKFPLTFTSGIMRARFHPVDGQLYLCGLRGWGTSAVKDGQFCRVRVASSKVPVPVGFQVEKNGLAVKFSSDLDEAATEDADNWAGTWTGILKKVPNAREVQEMPISTVKRGADRRTVHVSVEQMRTVPNFTLQYRIKSATGTSVTGEIHGTIHRIPQ